MKKPRDVDPTEACQSLLLPDDPTSEDRLGTHDRVAQLLEEVVSQEPRGRALVLLGSWGSGKSTVVRLLADRLEDEGGHCRVVVFDAWAHKGDDLRRAFLESLIRQLGAFGWISEQDWVDRLGELAGRREVVDVDTRPRLGPLGRALLVSILLSPLAIALFSKYGWSSNGQPSWAGRCAAALALAPFLIWLLGWALNRPDAKVWRKAFWKRPANAEVDSLFLERKFKSTVTTTIQGGHPTSLEFGDAFDQAIDEVVQSGRRIVIVLDNLDRVEDSEAQVLWATMRTFTTLEEHRAKSVWLLVPMDPSAPRRLWTEPQPNAPATPETTAQTGAELDVEEGALVSRTQVSTKAVESLGDTFIEKTFAASVTVPAPSSYNWRAYLLELFSEALPSHDQVDFERLYGIYRRFATLQGIAVTPRGLKRFVNQVSLMHRSRGHAIPLPTQALYLLVRSELDPAASRLNDPGLIPAPLLFAAGLNDDAWPLDMAALHLGVEREVASEAVMDQPIEQALVRGDSSALENWIEFPGFRNRCEEILERLSLEWIDSDPHSIASAAKALEAGDMGSTAWGQRQLGMLARQAARVEQWPLADSTLGENLALLVGAGPTSMASVLEGISKTRVRVLEEEEGESPGVWLAVIAPLAEALLSKNAAPTKISIRPGPDAQIAVARQLVESTGISPGVVELLAPQEPDRIESRLVELVGQDLARDDFSVLLPLLGIEAMSSDLVSALVERLDAAQTQIDSAERTARLNQLLPILSGSAEPSPAQLLIDSGAMLHHLWQTSQEDDLSGMSVVLAFLIASGSSGATEDIGESLNGRSLYSSIQNDPESSHEVLRQATRLLVRSDVAISDLISRSIKNDSLRAVTDFVLKMIAEESPQALTPWMLSTYPLTLNRALGTLEGFLDSHPEQKAATFELLAKGAFKERALLLYEMAAGAGKGPESRAITQALKTIRSMTTEEWLTDIKEDDAKLTRLSLLVRESRPTRMGEGLANALTALIRETTGGEWPLTDLAPPEKLLDLLDEGPRKTLLRNGRDLIVAERESLRLELLAMFGEGLISEPALLGEKDDDWVRHFIPAVLETPDEHALEWLISVCQRAPSALTGAPPESIATLRARVDELRSQDASEDLSRLLGAIDEAFEAR